MEYTKGTWIALPTGGGKGFYILAPNIREIAQVHEYPSDRGNHFAKANARLIAAAPQLLEALRACLTRLEVTAKHYPNFGLDEIMQAHQAIAKAEGKEVTK